MSQFVESLERRRMLSVSSQGTTVFVRGTETSDTIVFSLSSDGRTFDVYDNGVKTEFAGTVTRVFAMGLGGDDIIGVSQTNGAIKQNLILYGGLGNDQLVGGSGMDLLFGGLGDDALYGQGGNDWIWGGDGNDTMVGGDGNDRLWGNGGSDAIYGEAGRDRFDPLDATTGADAEVKDLSDGDFVGNNVVGDGRGNVGGTGGNGGTGGTGGATSPPPTQPPQPNPPPVDDDAKSGGKNEDKNKGRDNDDDDDDKDDDD